MKHDFDQPRRPRNLDVREPDHQFLRVASRYPRYLGCATTRPKLSMASRRRKKQVTCALAKFASGAIFSATSVVTLHRVDVRFPTKKGTPS